MGNDLESNEVDFEVDAGPEREPMEMMNHLHDTGVHMGFGFRMYSVQDVRESFILSKAFLT